MTPKLTPAEKFIYLLVIIVSLLVIIVSLLVMALALASPEAFMGNSAVYQKF